MRELGFKLWSKMSELAQLQMVSVMASLHDGPK